LATVQMKQLPRPDETANWGDLFVMLVRESRNKALSIPKFNILAVYKLPRLLDGFLIVNAFEELRA
jgi:hypothetical protein